METTADPAVRKAAGTYFANLDVLADRQAKALETHLRKLRDEAKPATTTDTSAMMFR